MCTWGPIIGSPLYLCPSTFLKPCEDLVNTNFLLMHVTPPGDQISNQCKWRHLVAKLFTNTSGATWWPNFLKVQVAPPGGQISI